MGEPSHDKNDGWKDVDYQLLDDPERNAQLSEALNEACRVFHHHGEDAWGWHDKDACARLIADEITTIPSLVRELLATGDPAIKTLTYRALAMRIESERNTGKETVSRGSGAGRWVALFAGAYIAAVVLTIALSPLATWWGLHGDVVLCLLLGFPEGVFFLFALALESLFGSAPYETDPEVLCIIAYIAHAVLVVIGVTGRKMVFFWIFACVLVLDLAGWLYVLSILPRIHISPG